MYGKKILRTVFAMVIALVYFTTTFASASAMTTSHSRTIREEEKISEPGLKKNIVLDDGSVVSSASLKAGDTVNFLLESNVPENLIDYLPSGSDSSEGYDLVIYDRMDAELIFRPESLCIKVNSHELSENEYRYELQHMEDYSLIRIELDLVELFIEHNYFDYEDFGRAPITIGYQATLTEEAVSGAYHNAAWLEYENKVTPEQVAVVSTYGIEIHKITNDAVPTALAGAEFEIYRMIDGNIEVLFENLVTDIEGIIRVDGLAAGVYYIRETKAPEGFVMDPEAFEIVLDENLVDQLAIVTVTNARITPPVHTGDASSYVIGCTFILVGIVACMCMMLKRRSKSEG